MTEAEKLCDDIFYGRVYLCNKCRRSKYSCTNAECLAECVYMTEKKRTLNEAKTSEKREQICLF